MSYPYNALIQVNAIYAAFQGEVNCRGIGAPVIFLRTQGCHLRCYKDTLGTLCDTPEALEGKKGGEVLHVDEIHARVRKISEQMGGTDFVCLSGGEPLWRKQESLEALFTKMRMFEFSVETSGTLEIEPYRKFANVHWVLDYKLKSCGIKQKFIKESLKLLDNKDFIKFVVYDTADYEECKQVIEENYGATNATFAVGPYWGGKISILELYNQMVADGIAGKAVLNVQLHKLAVFTDLHADLIPGTQIPQKI